MQASGDDLSAARCSTSRATWSGLPWNLRALKNDFSQRWRGDAEETAGAAAAQRATSRHAMPATSAAAVIVGEAADLVKAVRPAAQIDEIRSSARPSRLLTAVALAHVAKLRAVRATAPSPPRLHSPSRSRVRIHQRALAHQAAVLLQAQQQRDRLPQRGLVADHQHHRLAVGPAGRGQHQCIGGGLGASSPVRSLYCARAPARSARSAARGC